MKKLITIIILLLSLNSFAQVEPGDELQVTMSCLVKGATDVTIKITRIHYIK